MLEFKIIQELEPNEELLENIKNYNWTIKNGKIKHLRDRKYNIEIKNIRFTEEFISKNSKEYIK